MPFSGRLTDRNDIIQTPSGTHDNTALTLIQVLNLHWGLAVIYLYHSLFFMPVPMKRKMTAKILRHCFFSFFWFWVLLVALLLFLPFSCLFAISDFCYLLLSSGLPSLCLHTVLLAAANWHRHNKDQHRTNLLNISYKCTNKWFDF